jgi:hypothetical protein
VWRWFDRRSGRDAAPSVFALFVAPDIVMSADLAPDEPVLVPTVDSLITPDEVVTVPGGIKSTRHSWGTMVITQAAPSAPTCHVAATPSGGAETVTMNRDSRRTG